MESRLRGAFFIALVIVSNSAWSFDSGSTGADGVLAPNVDTVIPLPPDGVFNYSEITIPAGVTVTFSGNALNTPVTLLVSGDATINGTLDVGGEAAPPSSGAGDGNVGDDGLPGRGGPGGFSGGAGGQADPSAAPDGPRVAQSGIGPGGGRPSQDDLDNNGTCWGAGGTFATTGRNPSGPRRCGASDPEPYGNVNLFPIVGGSGGAGGPGFIGTGGGGGGGGGGALLLAVSGTLTVNGAILANGGDGSDVGHNRTDGSGGLPGGAGSGGALRLIATTVTGEGMISALGGAGGVWGDIAPLTGTGGDGRTRIEAETFTRAAASTPPASLDVPGDLVVVGMPTIRIAAVAGSAAPAEPTGNADIVLPADTANPVTVDLATTNVPLGNTITVIVTPPSGPPANAVSTALAGTEANATASAAIDLPDGPSVLLATLTFSVSDPMQQLRLSRYTGGEPVVAVELVAGMGGDRQTKFVTRSGRSIIVPAS